MEIQILNLFYWFVINLVQRLIFYVIDFRDNDNEKKNCPTSFW